MGKLITTGDSTLYGVRIFEKDWQRFNDFISNIGTGDVIKEITLHSNGTYYAIYLTEEELLVLKLSFTGIGLMHILEMGSGS